LTNASASKAVVAVRLWLPGELRCVCHGSLASLEAALLVALVAGDPARLARRTLWVRRIAVSIVVVPSRAATPVDFAFTQQMSPELASRLRSSRWS
jgi:hypothetical protein